MLGPSLSERLQLNLARLPTNAAVLGLDRLHLVQREKQMAFPRQPFQFSVGQLCHRNMAHGERVRLSRRKGHWEVRLGVDRMNDMIRQQPLAHRLRNHLVDAV